MKAFPLMPGVPALGHIAPNGYWHPNRPEGCVKCEPDDRTRVLHQGRIARVVHYSDIARCPIHSLSPTHYRDDCSCRCDEQAQS